MNLWSVGHFLALFVITFGWVQQQSNNKRTQKWCQKWWRNVQLIRGSLGKEILLMTEGLYQTSWVTMIGFWPNWNMGAWFLEDCVSAYKSIQISKYSLFHCLPFKFVCWHGKNITFEFGSSSSKIKRVMPKSLNCSEYHTFCI